MKYRPIIPVEARQLPPLTPGWHDHGPLSLDELAEWCGGRKFISHSAGAYILVPRFEGDMRAWASDWIVKDALGHFQKVAREDFELACEPLKETP